MSREELFALTKKEIEEIFDEKQPDLTEESNMVDELGFSSITFFCLVTALEDDLGIRIPERKVRRVETIKDLLDLLEEQPR